MGDLENIEKNVIMINAIFFYRIARWMYLHHIPVFPKLITLLIFLLYNSKIPYQASIGKNTYFGYGVIIFGAPKIGNNVFIGAGAKIIGPVIIGDNARIGAGCIVVKDVPANATCVMQSPRLIIKTFL